MHVDVTTDNKVRAYYFDLERQEFVEPWLKWNFNNFGPWANDGFGISFVAHRRDAFLQLPEGWTTALPGKPADQGMWHKFVRQPGCRVKFLRWPIALHFPAPPGLAGQQNNAPRSCDTGQKSSSCQITLYTYGAVFCRTWATASSIKR